ncbi:MAG: RNase H family protein [Candidatus Dormibacteraceae bacterium]
MNPRHTEFTIHSSGSYLTPHGPGGWASVVTREGQRIAIHSGSEQETTRDRMELVAVIEGLKSTPEGCSVTLVTGSRHVHGGGSVWWRRWEKHRYSRVKDQDLWKSLIALIKTRSCLFLRSSGLRVKGLNQEVIRLAENEAWDRRISTIKPVPEHLIYAE